LLSLFRTNQTANSIYFFIYILLLRSAVVIWPDLFAWQPDHSGQFSLWVYEWLGTDGWILHVVAALLLFVQAVYIALLTIKHRLGSEVSLFVGVFYIIMASALPAFCHLSPELMATTFFIIALDEVLSTYRNTEAAVRIFNIGFWLAIGSLFAPAYGILLFWGMLALWVLRSFRVRELLMLLIGAGVPYALLSTYFFWYGKLGAFWQTAVLGELAWLDFMRLQELGYVELIFFVLLALWCVFSRSAILLGAVMETRIKTDVIYWALLLCGGIVLVTPEVSTAELFVLVVPLGVLLGLRFLILPKRIAALLHFLLIVAILVWQLRPLWMPAVGS